MSIIEITETHIKLLEASGLGAGRASSRIRVKKIQDPSDQEVSKLLSSMVTSKTKKTPALLILSRKQVMVRYLSLPSHDDDEIKRMISFNLLGQVPYSKDDIIFDYLILFKEPSGYSTILSVVVHRDIINRYYKILSQCNVKLDQIQISSTAIVRWFSLSGRVQQQEAAVLNIDTVSSEICFCKAGKFLFSRHISFGARDIGGDREDDFIREIANTIEACHRERVIFDLGNIFLLFPENYIGSFLEKIQQRTGLYAEIIDPYEALPKAKAAQKTEKAKDDYYSFIVPLGASIKLKDKDINLLPMDVQKKRSTQERKVIWVKFFVLLALNLAVIGALFFVRVQKQKDYLENLQTRAQEIRPRIQALENKKGRISAIERHLDVQPLMVDIIHELYKVTPDDVSFRLVHVSGGNNVVFQGIAQSLSSVNTFQSQLVHSSMFKDVNLQYATQRRVFQGEITDFRIVAQIIRP